MITLPVWLALLWTVFGLAGLACLIGMIIGALAMRRRMGKLLHETLDLFDRNVTENRLTGWQVYHAPRSGRETSARDS